MAKQIKIQTIHLELNKQLCNQHCIFCNNVKVAKKIKSQLDYLTELIKFCRDNSVPEVIIQGGEPTISQEIFKILVELAKLEKTKISLITNGQEFNENWARLFVLKGQEINFSLNSADPENYAKICPGGNYYKVLENIVRFQVLKERYKFNNCRTAISMVVCTENIQELATFYEQAIQLKADKIKYFSDLTSPYRVNIPDEKFKTIARAELAKLLKKKKVKNILDLSELKVLADLVGYKLPKQIKKKPQLCQQPWRGLYIDHTLNVYPCCHSRLIWGNLKQQKFSLILEKISASNKIKDQIYKACPPNCAQFS